MAVCEIHLTSANVLNKMTSMMVILPEGMDGPFPVFYLLHGLSDNHTAWVRRTSIERYVQHLPWIVVMPDGGRSFYTDAKDRHFSAYETHIVEDIIGFVDNTFQTIPGREGRVIAGLSMGGYGALKLAFKHPDLFCAAASHSGALNFASRDFISDGEWIPVLGQNPKGGPDDLFAIVERADRKTLPAVRFDCGLDDFLLDDNRLFHQHLNKLGISHQYLEYPGEHTWAYWDTHIQETISFFESVLRMELS